MSEEVLSRAPVLWRAVPGLLVLRARGAAPVLVDGSGVEVWTALETPGTVDDVVDRLRQRHGVDAPTLRSDVEEVLAQLRDRGLVVAG